MGHARRQQPLYEVLSTSSRRPGFPRPVPIRTAAPASDADKAHAEPKPEPEPAPEARPPAPEVKVLNREPFRRTHAPAAAAEPAEQHAPAESPASDGALRLPASTMLILLAVLIGVVAVAWAIAYRMGVQAEAAKKGEQFPAAPGAGLVTGPESGNPPLQPPPPQPKPQPPAPQPQTGADPTQDPRIPGYNYLYLGTLIERDAAAGVAFLTQNGVPAFYVVDRAKAGGNNRPCRVYAAQGIPSDRYREMQRERDELVRRVEEIGRRWQREQKGASDFRQPYWTLHKG